MLIHKTAKLMLFILLSHVVRKHVYDRWEQQRRKSDCVSSSPLLLIAYEVYLKTKFQVSFLVVYTYAVLICV